MKIMSDGPVDLCFSNAKGDGLSADTVTAIGQTAAQVGSALAQRQRQFTEVEQKCGKRPSIPGKRRKAWEACATEYAKSASIAPSTFISPEPMATPAPKKTLTWVWITAGVVGLGLVGFIAYKASKR